MSRCVGRTLLSDGLHFLQDNQTGSPIGEIPDVVSPTPPVTLGQRRSYPARLAFFRYTPRTLMLLFTPAAPNYMPVQDLAAPTSWYVEKFGARPRPTKFDDGRRGAELWLADEVYFVLGPRDIPNSDETPMLYTPNIAKARAYLLARCVEATKIQRDRRNTKFFEMRDLEGNLIEICQQP